MQDTFAVKQNLSFGEYYRIALSQIFRSKIIRRLLLFVTCIGLLGGLLGLLASGENEKVNVYSFLNILIAPVSVALFFLVSSFLLSIYVVLAKSHSIRGITYRFTHWGMEKEGPGTEISIPWREFQKLKETKTFLLLYVREKNIDTIHVIQKRMFSSKEEAEQFKEFLETKLPL